MAQLAPSTIEYGKLISLIKDFQDSYISGEFKTPGEVAEEILNLMTKYEDIAGKPLLRLDPFTLGEPADSAKMNRLRRFLQDDVNLLQDQLNVLTAAAVFVHNFLATELELAKNQNAQASNKLKTLQLYSSAYDADVIQFGDYFTNLDFVDFSLVPNDQRASLINPGVVTLPKETESVNLSEIAIVKILNTSNGFSGNNQEAADTSTTTSNPIDGSALHLFKAQLDGRHAELETVLDGEPNTWFEYENYLVSDRDRLIAKGYNFVYKQSEFTTNTNSATDADGAASGSGSASTTDNTGLINWSKGPKDGVLRLDLEFDIGEIKSVNTISYTPFGLDNDKNFPIKISNVQTSPDGTDWEKLAPENVYVGTDANLQSARTSANVMIGSAVWNFDQRNVQFIRLSLEQAQPVDAKIVHVYYETKTATTLNTSTVTGSPVPGGTRVEGPNPPVEDPHKYIDSIGMIYGDYIQKTEIFDGKRWAIGIRDIFIEEALYKPTGVIISKPFRIDGVVDRVSIESDIFVPQDFSVEGQLWVRFYVSPDNGLNWHPISRIQDDFLGIPEIIAFNDPLPFEFREQGITYVNTNSIVNQLRVKVELSRPEELGSSSPVLKSYKLKVRKR